MYSIYKIVYSFEKRIKEATKVLKNHPDRIPVILEKNRNSKIKKFEKYKYLVPKDITVGQFIYVIRKKNKLNENEGIFLFINNKLPPVSMLMSDVYENEKEKDLFLYCCYDKSQIYG